MAKRNNIMLPTPFTEELFNRIPKPCIVQPKLEGDRARSEEGVIFSSSSAIRRSVPNIDSALYDAEFPWETDGELFVRGMKHSEIRSIVSRTKNLHADHYKMQYWIYDIVTDDDQYKRLLDLKVFRFNHRYWPLQLVVVPFMWVHDLNGFQSAYEKYLAQGFEGIIVRHPDRPYKRKQVSWMLKLKPRLSGEYEIIGVEPLVDQYGVVHELMGKFILKDTEGRKFKVGSGPTDLAREFFWKFRSNMIGKMCKIRFQGFTRAGKVPKMQSIDKEWLGHWG